MRTPKILSDWADVQADLSLRWAHMHFCWFCHEAAQFQFRSQFVVVVYGYLHKVLSTFREFGAKCAKCYRTIQPNDWVRRARDNVYHLACFACDSCKRQLSTGEEFALQGNQVLCKPHYLDMLEGGPNKGRPPNCLLSQQNKMFIHSADAISLKPRLSHLRG